jgi:hypothetical protein
MLSFRKLQSLSAFLIIAWLLLVPWSMAQSNVGEVNGTVYDQAGAVVPGAEVTLKDLDQGGVRKAISSASGAYVIPSVQPSRYSLTVINAGFKSYIVPEFKLDVNQARTFDVHLEVGAVTQSVEVKAQAVAVDRTDATIGDVIQTQEITEIPLNGRNFSQLMQLSTGVIPTEQGQQGSFEITGGYSPAVNGMRYQMNNFTLDGVDNNMRFTNSFATAPPPEAIAEYKVSSHESTSAADLAAGATVNVVTRGGSNALHGAAWDFLRNDILAANGFFNNLVGAENTAYKQNQFGFFVGGPVVIPHLIDGRKSRTFFSGYYEGIRYTRSGGTTALVPTAAERGGDFSSELGAAIGTDCLGRTVYKGEIYNPFTTVANSNCSGGYVRNPYQNNIVPSGQIQDFAKSYLQYLYPLPNYTGTNSTYNFVASQGATKSSNQFGLRGDHVVSDKLSVFGRVSRYRFHSYSPGALPANSLEQVNAGVNAVFHTTYVANPTLLADVAFGYNRASIPYRSTPIPNGFASAPGVTSDLATKFPNGYYPPAVTFSGSVITGTSYTYYALADPDSSWELRADLKKVMGSHSFEFGGHWTHVRHYTGLQGLTGLGFDPSVDNAPGIQGSGSSFAAFLVGVPWSSSAGNYPAQQTDTNIFTGYVGDTWKVTPKLTFDYGIQYVLATRPVVAGNKVALFDYDLAKTKPDATDFSFAYVWAGTNPLTGAPSNAHSRAILYGDHNNWAPRIGLAYAPNAKTVVRAGFGIYYDYNQNIVQSSIRGGTSNWPYSLAQSVSGINTDGPGTINYKNPFPPATATQALGSSTLGFHQRDPYAMEYNLGIERMLPGALKLSLGYVGAGARKLVINTVENIAPLGSSVPGSYLGRRPLHNTGNLYLSDDIANSNYHALQAELERRFAGGLTLRNSYTWSKSLDLISDAAWVDHYTYNRHVSDYGPSTWDMRHVNTTSFIYDLPFGRGKRFGSGMSKVADGVVGGWRVSSIVSIHTGLPYYVASGADNENTGSGLGFLIDPANQIADPMKAGPVAANPSAGCQTTISHGGLAADATRTRESWFNPCAFAVPALGTMGNISKNKYSGPGFRDFDMAAEKDFKIRESLKLQFRTEAFNLFNHTNFGVPSFPYGLSPSLAGGAATGELTGAANGAREIQFALKLVW